MEVRLSRSNSLTLWPNGNMNVIMRNVPCIAMCEMLVWKWIWPDIEQWNGRMWMFIFCHYVDWLWIWYIYYCDWMYGHPMVCWEVYTLNLCYWMRFNLWFGYFSYEEWVYMFKYYEWLLVIWMNVLVRFSGCIVAPSRYYIQVSILITLTRGIWIFFFSNKRHT